MMGGIRYIIMCIITISCCACKVYTNKSCEPYLHDYSIQHTAFAQNGGVASAHPLASKVGMDILQKGGNAIDAAIAIQLALAVVYPEAGNIGGGGFMIIHLANGKNLALDFREKAPAAATRNMYINKNGSVNTIKSLRGHLASGVPGTVAGIFESMQYAKLPFKTLIQPAIDLAENGYILFPSITGGAGHANPKYNTVPNVFDGSRKWKEGDTLRQPDLARTLKRIRDKGRKDFYEGETARLIVEEMKRGGGLITREDLKSYRAKWREPHLFSYRGYSIVSMPLPSSGGIILDQLLKMVEPCDMHALGFGSSTAISLMTEAERRAYRDRAKYLGDGDFSKIPVKELTSAQHLAQLMSDYVPGKAGVSIPLADAEMQPEDKETTHFSVVDGYGNAVAVTTTLNLPYGSQVVVGDAGFFLNNEMNDFSLKPGAHNASGGVGGVANSIEPGKRMLSSMTPTIVLKDSALFMVLGSPGGTTIPTSVFQTIVDVIDFGMSATDAVNKPKFHHEWLPDVVEMESGFSENTIDTLKKEGYKMQPAWLGRMDVLLKRKDGSWEIVADPRGGIDCAEGY